MDGSAVSRVAVGDIVGFGVGTGVVGPFEGAGELGRGAVAAIGAMLGDSVAGGEHPHWKAKGGRKGQIPESIKPRSPASWKSAHETGSCPGSATPASGTVMRKFRGPQTLQAGKFGLGGTGATAGFGAAVGTTVQPQLDANGERSEQICRSMNPRLPAR